MLHAQLVGDATTFGAIVRNGDPLPPDDGLGPIDVFKVGDRVVFVADPTGFVWRVRKVSSSGERLLLERPSGLQAVTQIASANDVVATSRSIRSPVRPADPTVVDPPAPVADKPRPVTNYILIGVGVLAVLGLGIAAARRLGKN
ncbi:MAG: hypothetical protein JSV86_17110 [Gemmatimonadota bacterium]|nr:MAG: hypothetical protein JSV86_17110 [Gemmatimonadota bacterium]